MPKLNRSKRFSPSAVTEKIIPAVLSALLLVLLAVVVLVLLSLAGIIPSA
jgi:ABC-type lipoprotein release transport system permease subunit